MAKSRSTQVTSAISAAQVSPLGEDPELLEPAEEALLRGAVEDEQNDAPAPSITTDYSSDSQSDTRLEESAAAPEADGRASERQTQGEGEERDLSDDQVRKLGPNDTVPAWSLVRERQENRDLKRKLEETARRLTEQEALWNRLNQRLRQAREQGLIRAADPEPDPRADPQAHQEWELRQQRQFLAEMHQQQQASAAHNQALAQQTMLASMEQQFIAGGHPDYFDRVRFVRERRDRELEMMGYADAGERARIIGNEGRMLIAGAVRQGRNPAEVVHELAEHWGYAVDGGGSRGAVARIRDAARNKAAAQSLQGVTARPPEGPLTLEDFAEMDDETYDRYVEKAGGDLGALLRR